MIDEDEFIAMYKTHGAAETARRLTEIEGQPFSERKVHRWRAELEKKLNTKIYSPNIMNNPRNKRVIRASQRYPLNLENGIVLVGSDAHYWPGEPSTAHRAFVHFCKKLKPSIVVMNGDVMDGARISRHARIGWDHRPTVKEEIETCKERLDEIRKASPRKAKFVWPLGNHDSRFETKIANSEPEYCEVEGFKLQDHFPWWEPCWSLWINDEVVIKHRFKNGIHATHNNTLWAGKTMLTGHLHSMRVTPFSDYNGTRFGVDCGTMMDPYEDQTADYTEDNPVNWRSGFVVLTFNNSQMMWPEIVHVIEDGKVEFRGELFEV